MAYADGFLIPAPIKNLAAYKKMSESAAKVWMEHGALDYKECVGDDLKPQGMNTSFSDLLSTKKGETVIFSWIVYKSRKHRDAVLKKVMADPRLQGPENMPFDPARMYMGGFEVMVDHKPKSTARKTVAKKAARAKKKKA
jgi:uncharacterized protein YbaA (DUF1428 family)